MALEYIVRKNLEVIRNRIKLSEAVDFFMDNLSKVLPPSVVEPVHHFFSNLVDEIIFC